MCVYIFFIVAIFSSKWLMRVDLICCIRKAINCGRIMNGVAKEQESGIGV